MVLTNVPELDSEILLKLDAKSLKAVSACNTYLHELCSSKYFRERKLQCNINMAWALHAKDTTKLKNLLKAGFTPEQTAINISARKGRLDTLKCLARYKFYPDQWGVNHAAFHGQLEVIKWCYKVTGLLPDIDTIYIIHKLGHCNVIQWLISTLDVIHCAHKEY